MSSTNPPINGLNSQLINGVNHFAMIVIGDHELLLYIDSNKQAMASIRRHPETNRIHCFSEADDADTDYGTWLEAYTDLEDWAHREVEERDHDDLD